MPFKNYSLRISSAAHERFPELRAWAVAAEWPADTGVTEATRAVLPADAGLSLETLATHPRIAPWRDAYRAMGLKPADCRSSIEQLVRRILRGNDINLGIAGADLYNQISLSFLVPMGGYDADRLSDEPLVLRPLAESDSFVPLGGDPRAMPLRDSVLGYCQGDVCLCYAINHRDATSTAIRSETERALFVSEAIDTIGQIRCREALGALAAMIVETGGRCSPVRSFEVER